MEFLEPHTRGRIPSDVVFHRCYSIVNKVMIKMEALNPESSVELKGKMIKWPSDITQKPIYEMNSESR